VSQFLKVGPWHFAEVGLVINALGIIHKLDEKEKTVEKNKHLAPICLAIICNLVAGFGPSLCEFKLFYIAQFKLLRQTGRLMTEVHRLTVCDTLGVKKKMMVCIH
jgi:hypothetical protein